MYIISHGSSHCEKDPDHSPCSNPYKFFLIGIAAFFLTFHFLFSFATVFSRWGIELLSSETMGRRLCILSELSWVFLLYLTTNGVVDWLISDFERGFFISLLNALGLSLFHHTGLAQRDLLWMIAGIILGWIRLVKYQTVRYYPGSPHCPSSPCLVLSFFFHVERTRLHVDFLPNVLSLYYVHAGLSALGLCFLIDHRRPSLNDILNF